MKPFLWLLLALTLAATGCQSLRDPKLQKAAILTVQPTSENWEREISAFEMRDRTNPPPRGAILFLGSSSIRMWKSLEKDFPGKPVFNRGFGGSQIIDSVYYADRIVFPYEPRLIVFYAGGNDINAGKSPEQVFRDFKLFVKKVHDRLPRTTIAYVSSAPNPKRWEQVEQVAKLNGLIKDSCRGNKRLRFIDVYHEMLGPDGKPKPDIYLDDRLHMNEKGYVIWRRIIRPFLD